MLKQDWHYYRLYSYRISTAHACRIVQNRYEKHIIEQLSINFW